MPETKQTVEKAAGHGVKIELIYLPGGPLKQGLPGERKKTQKEHFKAVLFLHCPRGANALRLSVEDKRGIPGGGLNFSLMIIHPVIGQF